MCAGCCLDLIEFYAQFTPPPPSRSGVSLNSQRAKHTCCTSLIWLTSWCCQLLAPRIHLPAPNGLAHFFFLASFKANKCRPCVCRCAQLKLGQVLGSRVEWRMLESCSRSSSSSALMRTWAASWLIVVCSLFAIHLYLLCDLFIQKHNNFPNLFFLYIHCCVYLFIWLLAKLRVWSFVPSIFHFNGLGSSRYIVPFMLRLA